MPEIQCDASLCRWKFSGPNRKVALDAVLNHHIKGGTKKGSDGQVWHVHIDFSRKENDGTSLSIMCQSNQIIYDSGAYHEDTHRTPNDKGD